MTRLVMAVEFLKKIVSDLHIAVEVTSVKFKDTFKPQYEGLSEVVSESQRAALLARFSFNAKEISNSIGYQ